MTESTGTATPGMPRGAPIRTVIVDEERLIHVALQAILRGSNTFVVVGAAGTVDEGTHQVRRQRPELVICETRIAGQSGLDLCRWVHRMTFRTRVAVLTHRDDPATARAAFTAGASAYLLKTLNPESLIQRLREVMCGQSVVDDRVGLAAAPETALDGTGRFGLSPRECEVLAALSLGLDNQMIAQRLHITLDTVKSHVKSILRKLRARDRTHAVAISLGAAADL